MLNIEEKAMKKPQNLVNLLIFPILLLIFTCAVSASNPSLNIKANDQSTQITVGQDTALSLKIDMDPGALLGNNADWWVVASTPSGDWYSYVYPSGWINTGVDLSRVAVAYQGPLFLVNPFEVLNTTNLPIGEYNIYFGVETNMNGILDYPSASLSYAAIKVNVSSATPTCTPPQVLQNGVCVTPTLKSGTWSGTTSQSLPFSFILDGSAKNITKIMYGYSASGCRMTGTVTTTGSFPISGSTFTDSDVGGCPSHSISGTLNTDGTASGSMILTFTPIPYSCSCSGKITTTWNTEAP